MDNIQKEPIRADQLQPTLQGSNSGLKIFAIIIFVVIGLPIILTIILLIFVAANFDKFTEWIDGHLSDYLDSAYTLDVAQSESVEGIYNTVRDTSSEKIITKSDCETIREVARKANLDFMPSDYCESKEIWAGAEDSGSAKSLYFWDNSGICGALDFRNEFFSLSGYRVTYGSNADRSSCKANTKLEISGIDDGIKKLENDDSEKFQRS